MSVDQGVTQDASKTKHMKGEGAHVNGGLVAWINLVEAWREDHTKDKSS